MMRFSPLFPEDPIFPESEAREHLAPIEARLRHCVLEGWRIVKELGNANPVVGSAYDYLGTRAHLVNAVIVVLVRREFDDAYPGLYVTTINRFVELHVEGVIDLRFKLVDKAGRSSNYPTDTSLRYRNQLPLFGDQQVLDVARITIGWRWDESATKIEDISVIYAKGDEPLWSYSILEPQEGRVAIPLPQRSVDLPPVRFASKGKKSKKSRGGA